MDEIAGRNKAIPLQSSFFLKPLYCPGPSLYAVLGIYASFLYTGFHIPSARL